MQELSFEEALRELEALARQLEEGQCPLEAAVKTFEHGMLLKNHCEQLLKEAKLKIEQILSNKDGTVTVKPFLTEEH